MQDMQIMQGEAASIVSLRRIAALKREIRRLIDIDQDNSNRAPARINRVFRDGVGKRFRCTED